MGKTKNLPNITKYLIKSSKPAKEAGPDPLIEKYKTEYEEVKAESVLLKAKLKDLQLKLQKKNDLEILPRVKDVSSLVQKYCANQIQSSDVTDNLDASFGLKLLQQQIKCHELFGLAVRRADDNYLFTQFRVCSPTKTWNYFLKLSRNQTSGRYSLMNCSVPRILHIKKIIGMHAEFHENPKRAIRLIALNCQVYENIRSQLEVLKAQFNGNDNINIFNTWDCALINLRIPMQSKTTGDVRCVEIELVYSLTCCFPKQVTIKSYLNSSSPDNYYKKIKSQFGYFQTKPLYRALKKALADQKNDFEFRWLTEDLDYYKDINLFPIYPPPGYKYDTSSGNFVRINNDTSAEDRLASTTSIEHPKTKPEKTSKSTSPKIKPVTIEKRPIVKPSTSKVQPKQVVPTHTPPIPKKFISSTPYFKKTNFEPNFSSISNVTVGKTTPQKENKNTKKPDLEPEELNKGTPKAGKTFDEIIEERRRSRVEKEKPQRLDSIDVVPNPINTDYLNRKRKLEDATNKGPQAKTLRTKDQASHELENRKKVQSQIHRWVTSPSKKIEDKVSKRTTQVKIGKQKPKTPMKKKSVVAKIGKPKTKMSISKTLLKPNKKPQKATLKRKPK